MRLDPTVLTTREYGREHAHYPVALSVDSLAQAWVRRGHAPNGAAVIADLEVSARTRHGTPWEGAGGLYIAVVVHPESTPEKEGLLWARAAVALTAAAGEGTSLQWPDLLISKYGRPIGMSNVWALLGPGRIDRAVLTFRLENPPVDAIGRLLTALEESEEESLLPAAFARVDRLAGTMIEIGLAPRGVVRGLAGGIDHRGRLVLVGPDRSTDQFTVERIRAISILDRAGPV